MLAACILSSSHTLPYQFQVGHPISRVSQGVFQIAVVGKLEGGISSLLVTFSRHTPILEFEIDGVDSRAVVEGRSDHVLGERVVYVCNRDWASQEH